METVEKNEIISKFMGDDLSKEYWVYSDEMHYHSDWNWIMECVSKIESLGFIFSIKGQSSAIRDEKTRQYLQIRLVGEDSTKIESVYNNCFQFIQWYNQKQETK